MENRLNYGIMSRVFESIFKRSDESFKISITCVELYNEEIIDLFAEKGDSKPRIRVDQNQKDIIENIKEIQIPNQDLAINQLQKGFSLRKITATQMNNSSSRSHFILTITLKKHDKSNIYINKLHLVDLAGSEKQEKSSVTNTLYKESLNINKSLLSLTQVINALCQKSNHIPFRGS